MANCRNTEQELAFAILAKNLQAVVKVLVCEEFFKPETIWSLMSLPQPVIVVSL